MTPGALDRRVRIERFEAVTDALGGAVKDRQPVKTVWASYRAISDGERWRSGQVENQSTARFVMRKKEVPDLTTLDRLVFDGEVYVITGRKELGRGQWWEITAGASDAD